MAMKYVIIIPDGAADFPQDALDGQTPFQAADKPHLDALAAIGRQGLVHTTPRGFSAGSDVCCMSLMGYDPHRYHKGRAPLEAAAMGIRTEPDDWIFRCNLVTVDGPIMKDHSAGHVESEQARTLLDCLAEDTGTRLDGITFHPGVSYRNLMIDRSGRDYANLQCTPPHDIPDKPWPEHLPGGCRQARVLREMIQRSGELFQNHPINRQRGAQGKGLANLAWLWGAGQTPQVPDFQSVYGVRGGVITAVDLLAGIGALVGFQRIDVPGITGYHDTNYKAKGEYAAAALDELDLVVVHIEAPDEASHQGDLQTKVDSIQAIDQYIVGPIHQQLRQLEAEGQSWRLLCLPDHYTCLSNRLHDPTPVPFMIAASDQPTTDGKPFNETNARNSGWIVEQGYQLMGQFINGMR